MKKKNVFKNRLALQKLHEISAVVSLDNTNSDHTLRCKFNFSYFDNDQPVGQDFKDWNHKCLYELFDKLKNYCKHSLDHWQRERVGGSGLTVLEIYGAFPPKSRTDFKFPDHVPIQAKWGRFRIGNKMRLPGFIIPPELHGRTHPITGEFYDKNTFYVVFLDRDHKFYKTEKK